MGLTTGARVGRLNIGEATNDDLFCIVTLLMWSLIMDFSTGGATSSSLCFKSSYSFLERWVESFSLRDIIKNEADTNDTATIITMYHRYEKEDPDDVRCFFFVDFFAVVDFDFTRGGIFRPLKEIQRLS